MAVASSRTKPTSKTGNRHNPKQRTQTHRRSRTGCYTCRLRRKKCDEGQPMCSACKHLGLACEYKRPMWWANNDARRQHKNEIKTIIKRKKLSEKAPAVPGSPPGLAHSLPTPSTFADPFDRTRSQSIDSHYGFNFHSPLELATPFATPQRQAGFVAGLFSPYEADAKTVRLALVDRVPTTASNVATLVTPPPPLGCTSVSVFAEPGELLAAKELDEPDQRLLDHFVQSVVPTLFPVLDASRHGGVSAEVILPALHNNRAYLHCCLSIAGQHLKMASGGAGDALNDDIMRHRYATISLLVAALDKDEDHDKMLDATLGMMFFQCCVGPAFDDNLSDIAWHQHFEAAKSLVHKLRLPDMVAESDAAAPCQPPFALTLAAWIDILGATMLGCPPAFAGTYRERLVSASMPSLGLRELMGCDDRVMYLISEIACLESLRNGGLDDMQLCEHVRGLGDQISFSELADDEPGPPFTAIGSLSPLQLARNLTAAFRIAARIYLCSLVPGFHPTQPSCVGLVDKLVAVLCLVPSGPAGFDRSLVWVYLIGGSFSLPASALRDLLDARILEMGDQAALGSFGRTVCVLQEVWLRGDADLLRHVAASSPQNNPDTAALLSPLPTTYVHWRDVMESKGWDFLLI